MNEKLNIVPVEGRLVRTVVEYLQELGAPKMEHEWRVEREILHNSETVWIIFRIFPELLKLLRRTIRSHIAFCFKV